MPPVLALTLCCLFVLALLIAERKANADPSAAAWLPTLWVLVAAGKPLGTWLGGVSGDEGSLSDQLFGGTLLIIGLLVLIARAFSWGEVWRANGWLMMLLLYMALSAFWSDIAATTFKRSVRELIVVVMACLIASEESPRRTMEAIFRRTAYVLIPMSLVLIKYFPSLGVQYRALGGQMWVGVAMQKNSLGRLCFIATFFLVWSLIKTRRLKASPAVRCQRHMDVAVLALAVFLLLGPGDQYSATALAAIAVGFITYMYLSWRHTRGAKAPAGFLVASAFALVVAAGTLQPFMEGRHVAGFASDLGRDVTLTGRTEIWAGLMDDVTSKPLFGTGVGSFWTREKTDLHEIGEAHNGYLDVVLSLGFTGLLLTALFLFASFRQAQREMGRDFDWGCLWLCFLFMAAVHNISESSFNSLTTHLMSTLVFMALALLPREGLRIGSDAAARADDTWTGMIRGGPR
jgi:exopolysaccharide production protein ExoQ